MKISFNWLKEYLDFNLSAEQTADILTNIGLEVERTEKWESVKGSLEGLVIGRVNEVSKHPDADKLTVTKVDTGGAGDLQIVCGAPNVAAGQKVIVAVEGTVLHPFEGESFKIKKTKIRGVESNGMICSEDEIGLSNDHSGIRILPDDAPVGMPVNEYLKVAHDVIFEIGLTPNRSDAMSHLGVARDLAAWLHAIDGSTAVLKMPDTGAFSIDDHSLTISVEVENTEACPRYSAITLTGVTVAESPEWLKQKLTAVGMRPINNVVDITNFVMLEGGQPLHAFDADEVKGKKVIVKTLAGGTPFRTLDNKEVKLAADDLMICHAEEGMCIAGVYGGLHSGVKDSTKSIFLESACFSPSFIRRTSTRHQLRTDAATRFEKGTDPGQTVTVLKRTAQLIREICGGKISSDIIDIYSESAKAKVISLMWEKLNRVSGIEFPKETAAKILAALQFTILPQDEQKITVSVPTFKTDVTMAEDLIEEIVRIFGMSKIPVRDAVRSSLSYSTADGREQLQEAISTMLGAVGFHEMINNSITNSVYHETWFPQTKDEIVRLMSYSNAGLDSMRTSLLFPALEAVRYNHNRKITDLRLFEFGKTYRKTGIEYAETDKMALLLTGNKRSESWQEKEQAADFFFLKGNIETILRRAGIAGFTSEKINHPLLPDGLQYSVGRNPVGVAGRVNQKLTAFFDIRREVFYAELELDELVRFSKRTITYKEPSKFPTVRRDLAMILDDAVSFADIESLAFRQVRGLLREVNLFDVYKDEKLGAGKKSYAVSFILLDEQKTLTDKEVDDAMAKLIRTFEKELGAAIRSN
jgi:phenylalanyl-tRNA synthetase beta chain